MFKLYQNYIYILILLVTVSLQAQQDPNYTQYMYNTMTINPAYVGSSGTLNLVADYRSQWLGFDGAPETMNFGLESPLTDAVGLGLNITRDVLGPSEELNVDGNFSYNLQLSRVLKIAFGLKAGLRVLNIDFTKGSYQDPNDPLFMNDINNRLLGTIGLGSYLYTDEWYLGLSVPNFFTQQYYDDVEQAVDADELHFYFIGGYVFDISENTRFKPALLMNYVNGTPLRASLSGNFLMYDKLTLGAAYKLDAAVSALAGFQISKNLFLGYSYDYSTNRFNAYNDGTHEIILKFSFARQRGITFSPRFF